MREIIVLLPKDERDITDTTVLVGRNQIQKRLKKIQYVNYSVIEVPENQKRMDSEAQMQGFVQKMFCYFQRVQEKMGADTNDCELVGSN